MRSSQSNQHTTGGVSTLRSSHFLSFAQPSNKTNFNIFSPPRPEGRGNGSKDRGNGSKDQGNGSKDQDNGSKDQGNGSKDRGNGSKDRG
ncbi:MAG: hypothetical protein Q7U54_08190 [Bacteroidales bacterium]|nr:hypothetical protein [Bacteroidales bacterium]